jgi:surface antigen
VVEIGGLSELNSTTDVGVYILTATTIDPDYLLTNTTTTYAITPRPVTVNWGGTFTSAYGAAIANDITATFEGGTADIGGKPGAGANAGSYIITASTANKNYILTNATRQYEVTPKTVAVNWGGTFTSVFGATIPNDTTATFDGGTADIGGKPSAGEDAGSYIITASTANKNYILTNATRQYEITPKTVAVNWGGTFSSVFGAAIANDITATFEGGTADIGGKPGAGANAGSYILTASTANKNYILTNAMRRYEITPKSMAADMGLTTDIVSSNSNTSTSVVQYDVNITAEGDTPVSNETAELVADNLADRINASLGGKI